MSEMGEEETKNRLEVLEVFKAEFERGLQDLLDSAEVLLDRPRPIDPFSMGFDERTMEELSLAEKEAARQIIYQVLDLEPDRIEEAKLRKYTTHLPEGDLVSGEIQVEVFRTNIEDIFLQELTFLDGGRRWLIGPDQDI